MPISSVPKYPVVDPSPKLDKVLYNFSLIDCAKVGGFTTAGYVFGWFTAHKPFRVPQSRFLAGLGLVAGLSAGALSTTQRFLGLEPNAGEIQKYGVLSQAELEIKTKQINTPNLQLIDESSD